MNASKLRQYVDRLDQQRRKLLSKAMRPLAMVSGSLYQMRRRCGNARCKCARGALHASWYLSRRVEGRTRLFYIGRIVPESLCKPAYRYQRHQKLLAQIRRIDGEISRCLNQLRDQKIEPFNNRKEKQR